MKSDARILTKYLLIFLVAILFALANIHFGMYEFGGYDLSALIDSGWRVMSSQLPTRDFIATLPPSLYLATDIAFKLFGVHWNSILLAEDFLFLLLCALGLRVCWILHTESEPEQHSPLALVYVALQSVLLLSVNHLWHSTMASAFGAYAILATYALLRCSLTKWRIELNLHLAFVFAVLLLCKPNTAWTALLLCLFCIFISRHWIAGFRALGLAVLLDIALLTAFGITPYEAFAGYFGLSERLLPRLFIVGIYPERNKKWAVVLMITYLLLAPVALKMIRVIRQDQLRQWLAPDYLLCLGAVVVSLIGLGTNWDFKIVDVTSLVLGAAILMEIHPENHRSLSRPLLWSTILLLLFALFLGVARIRMKEVGAWAGSSYGQIDEIHDRFFGNFKTRQAFDDVLRDADLVVARSSGRQIFVGPRLEFLYAREGLRSPAHLPIWWHPGSSYSLSAESQIEKIWEDDRFDVLIFAKHDRTRFPTKLLNYIDTNYTQDPTFNSLDVFYLKQPDKTAQGSAKLSP